MNNINVKTRKTFDENGNFIKFERFNKNEKVEYSMTYNSDNLKIKTIYHYDEDNNLLEVYQTNRYSQKIELLYSYTYSYNLNGELDNVAIYHHNDGKSSLKEILYFDKQKNQILSHLSWSGIDYKEEYDDNDNCVYRKYSNGGEEFYKYNDHNDIVNIKYSHPHQYDDNFIYNYNSNGTIKSKQKIKYNGFDFEVVTFNYEYTYY